MVAGGYPGDYRKGAVINGLPTGEEEGVKLFHAGTTSKDGRVVTNGGRVLCATALGATVQEAQRRAYELARRIHWDGVYYRGDIGYRAIRREQDKV
jgi:phosphoribosylamine--glycine ligase